MNKKDITGFIKKIIVIDVVSTAVIFVYWFMKGPQNTVHLVDCFFFGGIFLMIPGALIYIGPRPVTRLSFNRQQILTEKTKSEKQSEENKKNNLFFRRTGIMLLLSGTLLILTSLLIYAAG